VGGLLCGELAAGVVAWLGTAGDEHAHGAWRQRARGHRPDLAAASLRDF
jgi:hypothetical protein